MRALLDRWRQFVASMDAATPRADWPPASVRFELEHAYLRGARDALGMVFDGERHDLDDEAYGRLAGVLHEVRVELVRHAAHEVIERAKHGQRGST